MSQERVSVLGVGISPVNMALAIEHIDECLASTGHHYVCVAPAHSVMDCRTYDDLREIFNLSSMVTPDGMSIVWLLQLMGYSHVRRVYGPDLVTSVCRRFLTSRRRHYFYGGGPGVARKLVQRLAAEMPDLQIAGYESPPSLDDFPRQDPHAIDQINATEPDIVWLGVSTPKQERWMAQHAGKIASPLMIGVGASFDFLSGSKLQAPKWVQRVGMEWLFRLMSEPRRLWPRYRQYPEFVVLALSQLLGLRKYPL